MPVSVCPWEAHLSPMGIIPKKNKPNKWRLIVDLSSPEGPSINDGIDQECSSLSYTSIDHHSTLVVSEGRGSFMVKADIKEAYRMVPVRTNICWECNGETLFSLTRCYHLDFDLPLKYFQPWQMQFSGFCAPRESKGVYTTLMTLS